MRNFELAAVFDRIADYLELAGENPYKIRAYRRGADAIRALTEDIADIAARGRLRSISGIGAALEEKIQSWLASGRIRLYDELQARFPAGLLDVMNVPGVGPKLTARLFAELGVSDLESLEAAVEAKTIRTLKGCGPRTEERIAQGIRQVREGRGRMPIGEVMPRALELYKWLENLPGVQRVALAGSLRRGCEMVKDIDMVVGCDDSQTVRQALAEMPGFSAQPIDGDTKSQMVLIGGLPVDIRLVPVQSFITALHHFTGSQAHHVRLREWARSHGWHINEYRLANERQNVVYHPETEADFYRCLDLPYIAPELREDRGEFEAAVAGSLPERLEVQHFRGDIHVHSNWSDGRMSLEEIARAAADKGLEYVAVCDHSPALPITRGLDPERLAAQAEAIDALNAAGGGAWLLKGIEVDILPDGSLDLPDAALKRLDLVVASVHTSLGQSEEEMTARILRAMEHPHVDVIGHPTGRKLGQRPPYAVNVDALIQKAAETGTMLEINASPARMDLSADHARKAIDAGVTLVMSSDAHGLDELGNFSYGLMAARRAWVEPRHLLNCRSLSEIRDWLRRPKAERVRGRAP